MTGLVVMSLIAQAALVAAGAASQAWDGSIVACVAFATVALQACWFALDRRAASIFEAAQERVAELKQLDAFRARICGTLFHDVANFVHVGGILVELAERRGALGASEAATLRGFHERLAGLLLAALEVLEHGELESSKRVVPAPLQPMFEELRALFQYRLSHKRQRLEAQSDAQLSVLAVPVLLRDSILANLISNAMAERQGARFASTEGTAGEQGLGLGLTLAAEHLRRMGGGLRLHNHAQGGEAIVRVPLA